MEQTFPLRPLPAEQQQAQRLAQRLKGIKKHRSDVKQKPEDDLNTYERALLTHPPMREGFVDNPLIPKDKPIERPAPTASSSAESAPQESPAERLRRLLDEHRKRLEAERVQAQGNSPSQDENEEDDEEEDNAGDKPAVPHSPDEESPSARLARYLEERRKQKSEENAPPPLTQAASPPPYTMPALSEEEEFVTISPQKPAPQHVILARLSSLWDKWEPRVSRAWHAFFVLILWTLIVVFVLRAMMLSQYPFDVTSLAHWRYVSDSYANNVTIPAAFFYLPIAHFIAWLVGAYVLLIVGLWERLHPLTKILTKVILLPFNIIMHGVRGAINNQR